MWSLSHAPNTKQFRRYTGEIFLTKITRHLSGTASRTAKELHMRMRTRTRLWSVPF